MGCGSSKGRREDYSTLGTSAEVHKPLVSSVSARPTARELLDIPAPPVVPVTKEKTPVKTSTARVDNDEPKEEDPFASIVNRPKQKQSSSSPAAAALAPPPRQSPRPTRQAAHTTSTSPPVTPVAPPQAAKPSPQASPAYSSVPSSSSPDSTPRNRQQDSPDPPSFVAPPSVVSEVEPPSLAQQEEEPEKKRKKKKKKKHHHHHKTSSTKRRSSKEAKQQTDDEMDETPQPSSSSGMSFDELYKLKGVLGTGAFSTVREANHRVNPQGVTYAVKCVNRKKLSKEDEAALLDEVHILKAMRHEHIIRLYDFFAEPSHYYLVMERMSGGELFDRIVAKAYYNEKEARDVCKILLKAVAYCHAHHVAHRDLKPENLLLLSEKDDSAVKIADFGFAKVVEKPNSLKTQCGTPGYVAPEILEGVLYDERADMWSVGVILYILLGGYPPFIENNQRELFRKIRKGDYEFHPEYWSNVSQEAKELIVSLLTVKPAMRFSAKDALRNQWIREDDKDLEERDLEKNFNELKKFNAKRKFKAAVSVVMASNKLQSLGKDFLKNLS